MPTLISRGRCLTCSASASGSVICSSAKRWYVVVTIRKIRITSRTSINGTKLISGSSRTREPRKFIAAGALFPFLVRDFDQLDRLLLHFQHQIVDPAAEVAIKRHAGYRADKSVGGGVARDRNAVRQLSGVARRRRARPENLDHPDHGAEQPHQRRQRRYRSQRGQKAFQIVRHGP